MSRFDDTHYATVSSLLDLDLRTGTPLGETDWLNGSSGGSYPGTLDGFVANNADGNTAGSMRLVINLRQVKN